MDKKLQQALTECYRLLEEGAGTDECLRRYPELADQLREVLAFHTVVSGELRHESGGTPAAVRSELLSALERERQKGSNHMFPIKMPVKVGAALAAVLLLGGAAAAGPSRDAIGDGADGVLSTIGIDRGGDDAPASANLPENVPPACPGGPGTASVLNGLLDGSFFDASGQRMVSLGVEERSAVEASIEAVSECGPDESTQEEEPEDTEEDTDGEPEDAQGDNAPPSARGHEACSAATQNAKAVLNGLLDGSFFENLDLPDQAQPELSAEERADVEASLQAIEECGTGADDDDVDAQDDDGGPPDNVPPGPPDGVPPAVPDVAPDAPGGGAPDGIGDGTDDPDDGPPEDVGPPDGIGPPDDIPGPPDGTPDGDGEENGDGV